VKQAREGVNRIASPASAGDCCSREPVLDGGHIPEFIVSEIAAKARPVSATWKNRRWTFDELVAKLPESKLPTPLRDGELVMSPAPSFLHPEIVDRFHDLLSLRTQPEKLPSAGDRISHNVLVCYD